jgi:hypothetical protein
MLDRCCDRFQHPCAVGHDVVIAEAQHAKTLTREKGVPTRVALLVPWLKMLTAIDLDDETCGMADEIYDVWTNRGLATKACALHPMVAQRRPYQSLGSSRVCSQRARSNELLRGQMPAWSFRRVGHDQSCLSAPTPSLQTKSDVSDFVR